MRFLTPPKMYKLDFLALFGRPSTFPGRTPQNGPSLSKSAHMARVKMTIPRPNHHILSTPPFCRFWPGPPPFLKSISAKMAIFDHFFVIFYKNL